MAISAQAMPGHSVIGDHYTFLELTALLDDRRIATNLLTNCHLDGTFVDGESYVIPKPSFSSFLVGQFQEAKAHGRYPDHDVDGLVGLALDEGLVGIKPVAREIGQNEGTVYSWFYEGKLSFVDIAPSYAKTRYRAIKSVFLDEHARQLGEGNLIGERPAPRKDLGVRAVPLIRERLAKELEFPEEQIDHYLRMFKLSNITNTRQREMLGRLIREELAPHWYYSPGEIAKLNPPYGVSRQRVNQICHAELVDFVNLNGTNYIARDDWHSRVDSLRLSGGRPRKRNA
jgi:hypothetical protein